MGDPKVFQGGCASERRNLKSRGDRCDLYDFEESLRYRRCNNAKLYHITITLILIGNSMKLRKLKEDPVLGDLTT